MDHCTSANASDVGTGRQDRKHALSDLANGTTQTKHVSDKVNKRKIDTKEQTEGEGDAWGKGGGNYDHQGQKGRGLSYDAYLFLCSSKIKGGNTHTHAHTHSRR